jgi:DNA-binding transcriptional MerR regulator/predicted RNase H-like HicB family nuclease
MYTSIGRQFTTSTVSELTGASPRMLDYWARTGILQPSGQEATGRGSRRRYTFQDIVALLTICKLREGNCPLQKVGAAVRHLRARYPGDHPSQTLARLTLLTDGRNVYTLTDEHQVMEVVTRQTVWSVPLGLLIVEAAKRVEATITEWDQEVMVGGTKYRLRVSKNPDSQRYSAECRRLPGLVQQGATPREAVEAATMSIASLLEFKSQSRRQKGLNGADAQ